MFVKRYQDISYTLYFVIVIVHVSVSSQLKGIRACTQREHMAS